MRHWVAFLVWEVDCLEQSGRLEWLEKKHAMSQYANYTVASEDYDKTRAAVGVESILGCLSRTGVLLDDQTVLEAGCGTGNYLEALRPHLGCLAGMDFSEGMLAQARTKLSEDVELTCGSILDMPYEDERFDGITCNQVIHHLEEGPGASDDPAAWKPCSFPSVTQFFQEAYRVLKPGGAFVINATSHKQFRDGYWWADLIPVAVARLSCRMPDLDQLRQILTAAGFDIEAVSADLDGILQGPSYLDPQGPLSEAWRAGDSTWSLTSDAELAEAQQRVRRMNAEGTMQSYLDERESKRSNIGQTTFVCGRK
ncbi:MAG: class I SAM-dependent methyltransferase [Planctomycetes bacterium]|nr:class I SAM-dependent methyltransferase [Planctomycetota bacterium]